MNQILPDGSKYDAKQAIPPMTMLPESKFLAPRECIKTIPSKYAGTSTIPYKAKLIKGLPASSFVLIESP